MPKGVTIDAARIETLYRGGWSPSELSDRFGPSPRAIRRILRERNVPIRPQGRQVGWRKLSPKEVVRRIAAGAASRTWTEYRKKARLPKTYNVRLDRRLGVRLLCFSCGKQVSETTGRVNGLLRQLCRKCAGAAS